MTATNTFLAITLTCLLAITSSSRAADQQVHLFILSGQSNMAGMNPKTGFEPETAKLFPDAEVAYIKVARGGQPIRHWVASWNAIAKKHGLGGDKPGSGEKETEAPVFYQQILDQYAKLIAKHPHPASVTFCWMQGERDAKTKLSATYPDALRQLIADLRRDLKQPKMNVVIARISDFGKKDDTHWEAVRKAHIDVANADPHGAWVDCDDLNDKVKKGATHNDLHYTKPGYELLGRRYARQAKALIDGKKPAPNGRPE